MLATLALGWLWMLPSAFAQLGSDAFASAAFFANIALLLQSGYFDVRSAKSPCCICGRSASRSSFTCSGRCF